MRDLSFVVYDCNEWLMNFGETHIQRKLYYRRYYKFTHIGLIESVQNHNFINCLWVVPSKNVSFYRLRSNRIVVPALESTCTLSDRFSLKESFFSGIAVYQNAISRHFQNLSHPYPHFLLCTLFKVAQSMLSELYAPCNLIIIAYREVFC